MANVRNFFSLVASTKSEAIEASRYDLAEQLDIVTKYIGEGGYLSRRPAQDMSLFITMSDKDLTNVLGKSQSSVSILRKRHSDQLYSVFGSDFFELFKEDNAIDRVTSRVDSALTASEFSITDYVLPGIVAMASKAPQETFELTECKNELYFLRHFSPVAINMSAGFIDEAKLAYLVRVLAGEENTKDKQGQLRGIVGKPMSVDIFSPMDLEN